jgi:hypothetical protein
VPVNSGRPPRDRRLVLGQLSRERLLDPDGKGLRADIASSYRTVCQQARDLGLKACAPDLIQPRMPVVGLVALANYKSKSRLWSGPDFLDHLGTSPKLPVRFPTSG